MDGILAERPDDAILGEEGTDRNGTTGVRWVIDPLDGTASYVRGYPGYAVSIGIEVADHPSVGVVVDALGPADGRRHGAKRRAGRAPRPAVGAQDDPRFGARHGLRLRPSDAGP